MELKNLLVNSSQIWKSGLHSPFEGQFPCEKRKVEEEGKVLKPLL